MQDSEFDLFATDYATLHDRALGSFGRELDYFARYKIEDVAREAGLVKPKMDVTRILDFGAGCGNSIAHFRALFPDARLTCLDVSAESLKIAAEAYAEQADFQLFDGALIPYRDESFDLVFSACVFHHIEHSDHVRHFCEIHRVLNGGGLLCIFEHNPYNPVTRKIVRDCPFDANAQLITASVLKKRLLAVGLSNVEIHYRLFFPHSLRILRKFERFLTWLPLGGQYYVIGRK